LGRINRCSGCSGRRADRRGEPIEDLCQAASVGLIKAVDGHSPERGDAFAAYAHAMILGEIRRHFRDTTWRVHVPRPMRDRAGYEPAYERAEMSVGIRRTLLTLRPRDRQVVLLRLACDLTQDEIAGRIGISQMHVSRILRSAGAALSTTCGLAVGT
jgi:RNA polymerase sigma factor (sigma-70 family)